MNSRALYTRVAPYQDRLAAWKAAVDAAEKHVKMGLTLQGQGGKILQSNQDADPEVMARLIQQATATISHGIKIERDARDKIIELYQHEPREK